MQHAHGFEGEAPAISPYWARSPALVGCLP